MAANTIDLTTVAQVQAQGNFPTAGDPSSSLIQAVITAISRHILTRTGRDVLNGTQAFVDVLDGSGSDKQFVRNYPIQSVTSVQVFGTTVVQSPDGINPGWVIDSYAASIALLPGTAIGAPISYSAWLMPLGRFPLGRQNVKITYTAGYAANGGPGPHPPQDATFNNAPTELGQAVTEFVVQQLKRREWVDIASKTIASTGETVSFRSWEIPPWLVRVIEAYKRTWIV